MRKSRIMFGCYHCATSTQLLLQVHGYCYKYTVAATSTLLLLQNNAAYWNGNGKEAIVYTEKIHSAQLT